MQYIAAHPDRPLRPRALGRELGVPADESAAFRAVLREMIDRGELSLGRGRTLAIPDTRGTITGVFRANRRGFGFLEVAGRPDLFVPESSTGDALDGDTVAARLVRRMRPGDDPAAEIVRVIQRAAIRYVGVLEHRGTHWFIQPQGKAPAPTVSIDDPTAKSARPGDLVVVEPLSHTLGQTGVRGVIVERLGPPDESQARILAVVRRFGLPHEFPEPVRAEAQRVVAAFSEDAVPEDREDLRELQTITIDPPDARDFDDAISIEPLRDGRFRLGVHIADVSHFIEPGGAIDQEALLRSTSVYFPGYVVPMLPEVLSNGVCSLQPQRPRLTRSAFITYDRDAQPVETHFSRSIIRSAARFTYDEVTHFLAAGAPPPFDKLIRNAERLARAIRSRRIANGMIVLAVPELEIELREDGFVKDARPADTSFSHTIIEMFMVEANEAVSRRLTDRGVEHLRRIHPPPAEEAGERFSRLVAALDHSVRGELDRNSIRKLLDAARGKPEEPAVNYLLLRCMAQASYSPAQQGHFALASEHYCHFTSPIRRYPDLVNHRLLDIAAARGARREEAISRDVLEAVARQCNFNERRAQDAEREAKSALLVAFMRDKRGQSFDAVVVGVASAGVFVQTFPHMAEGLIHKADLGSDFWHFDRDHSRFEGRRSGRTISIGQPLRVVLVHVDETKIELGFVPEDPNRVGRLSAPRKPSRDRKRPKTREKSRSSRGRKSNRRR